MAGQVKLVITGKKSGTAVICPYSHRGGLQQVMAGGVPTGQFLTYEVPCYGVSIERGGTYNAVRFGLQNNGTAQKTRNCDAGLSQAQVCTPAWDPSYSPHSFRSRNSSRPGAWVLYPGKGFLIHEGAGPGQIGGSLGCVEILGGRWNAFMSEIETLAGFKAPEIGRKGMLTVSIEYAPYPTATLTS